MISKISFILRRKDFEQDRYGYHEDTGTETTKILAVRAGIKIMEIYAADTFEVSYKEDAFLLTIEDKASNQIIVLL